MSASSYALHSVCRELLFHFYSKLYAYYIFATIFRDGILFAQTITEGHLWCLRTKEAGNRCWPYQWLSASPRWWGNPVQYQYGTCRRTSSTNPAPESRSGHIPRKLGLGRWWRPSRVNDSLSDHNGTNLKLIRKNRQTILLKKDENEMSLYLKELKSI